MRESHRVPGLPHKRVCGLLPLSPSPATSLCISHHGPREPTCLPCLVPTQLFIMTRAPCDYVPGPRRAHGSYRLWPADKSAKGGGVQRPVLPEQPLSWAGAQVCGAGPQPPTCRGCPQMARVGGYRAGLSPVPRGLAAAKTSSSVTSPTGLPVLLRPLACPACPRSPQGREVTNGERWGLPGVPQEQDHLSLQVQPSPGGPLRKRTAEPWRETHSYLIGHRFKKDGRGRDFLLVRHEAVGQVAAVGQVEAHDAPVGLHQGGIDCEVGRGAWKARPEGYDDFRPAGPKQDPRAWPRGHQPGVHRAGLATTAQPPPVPWRFPRSKPRE